jgi:ribosomal protein L11 methyltransferase
MPPDRWLAVEVRLACDEVDLASGALWGAGAAGVEEVEDGGGVRLRAMVLVGAADAVAAVAARYGRTVVVPIDPDDGRDGWRAWARPVTVGRIVLQPAWQQGDADPTPDTLRIHLDPGRAFGSGSHPTTRLMLELLQDHPVNGAEVLDVGSGSGVLSVAAARLGAGRVVAVDIDPDAVAATVDNATRNQVADRIEASGVALSELDDRFDLVLANLSASVVRQLAPVLGARVRVGGTLMVSGHLRDQESDVAGTFPSMGIVGRRVQDGWSALALQARA